MKLVIEVEPGSPKHLKAIMIQKDLERKALAFDFGCSQTWLVRAFDLSHPDFRTRLIKFIEKTY